MIIGRMTKYHLPLILLKGKCMRENDSDLLFSSLIKVNYDKRFIRTAQNFVEDLSGLAGASKKEIFQISLLVEESLSFIVNKYIDCRVAAYIEVCFKVMADGKVCIDIVDVGPPIHESMIPSFDIADEDSEAGLWYRLVQGLSDKFIFINQLSAGWLIQIEKYIEDVTFSAVGGGGEIHGFLVEREDTSGKKQIRSATIEDVPALIDLAYMTYRYSYVFPDFYDRDLLCKYIDENLYEIMVIEHDGKVVGAYAIKYLDCSRKSAEVGAAMISPAYRGTKAISLMLRDMEKYVRTNPHHCEIFLSSAVTSHVRSQKGLSRIHNGFKPLMIFLNMVPKPEFVGIDHKSGGRESGLYVYHLNQKLKIEKLYVTAERHLTIINELIAYTENEVEVLAEFLEPEVLESKISVQRVGVAQFVIIRVESIGRDWFSQLSKRIISEIASGMESLKVTIPTVIPLPADMEMRLADLNLVFCGLSPRSLECVDLAYCLTTKPVDFSLIKLHEPVAQKLLIHIEQSCCGCEKQIKDTVIGNRQGEE